MDDLFESAIAAENINLGTKTFDATVGYYSSEVVAVYKQGGGRRRKRQTDLIIEVELAVRDGAITPADIDTVYNNGTLADLTVISQQPSEITVCKYVKLLKGIYYNLLTCLTLDFPVYMICHTRKKCWPLSV